MSASALPAAISTELIQIDYTTREVKALQPVLDARNNVLQEAQFVSAVVSPQQNSMAVECAKNMQAFLKSVEAMRKTAKEPFFEMGKKIDALAKEIIEPVSKEAARVNGLIGDYMAAQLARQRAEEDLRNRQMEAAEKEKQEKLAQAQTIDEREEIRAEFSQKVAELPSAPTLKKAAGQSIEEQWEFELEDPFLFARMHPNMVKQVVPDRLAVKDALKAGVKVFGVKSWKTVVSKVRQDKPKTVDV